MGAMRIKTITLTLACLFLGAAATQAYIRIQISGKTLHWGSNSISYHIHNAGSDDISDGSHIPAIEHAFASWSDVNGSQITLNRGSNTSNASTSTSQHTIVFDEDNSSGYFPSGSGIVAITPISYRLSDGQITDADILFNGSQFSFSTDQTPGTFDVQDVLTHEVGHFIGLDHSPSTSSTMWPYVAPNQWIHRSLSQDDQAGAVAIAVGSNQTKVTGRIFKPNGSNPLSGAIVSASLSDGRFVASAITNSNGNFNFRGIPAGDYHFCVTPLEGGMTSANLTSNYAVNTSFAPTFYGDFDNPTLFVLNPGANLGLGSLTVQEDIAMKENSSSTTLLKQGESKVVTIFGSNFPAGTILVDKTSQLTISNVSSGSSFVRGTVSANSAAMLASYDLYLKAPNGDFEVASSVVEVIASAPNLAGVSRFKNSSAGGETLTLTGSYFQPGCFVLFGGIEAAEVTYVDSNTLDVITPAVPLSIVDVAVHNPDGQQSVLEDGAAFTGQAMVSQSWPNKGQSSGGTKVFLNGDNFNTVTEFFIDGQSIPFEYHSSQIVHLTMPPHSLGDVTLTVRNPAASDLEVPNFFEYIAAPDPSITGFTPRKGPKGGGTLVDLFGEGFIDVVEVRFGVDPVTGLGGVPAAVTTTVSSNAVKALTSNNPAAGSYAVKLVTSSGQGSVISGFTFEGSNYDSSINLPGGGCSVDFDSEQGADFKVLIPQYLLTILGWLLLRSRIRSKAMVN